MLTPFSPGDAQRFRDFLTEICYTQEELSEKRLLRELPSRRVRNLPRLLDQTREAAPLCTVLRWFLIGVPVDARTAAGTVPDWFTTLCLEHGLLSREADALVAQIMLTPTEHLVFAADPAMKIESAECADLVLWPNPTTRLLHRFTIRRPSRATLDLGAGCGMHAVLAASHSRQVVATDLNPRATAFAAFNARLNGVENVECLTGDTFEPVAGRAFDLIVANPPFFVSPWRRQLFSDNPMDLDQYCRKVVREAPLLLHEGGFFQMLFEWVRIRGQEWRDRLLEWLEGSGCDAWIILLNSRDPAGYAQERICETTPYSPEADAANFAEWMDYYRRMGVEEIYGGMLALHRRSGANWLRIDELPVNPSEPFGDFILQAFAARDYLASHSSDAEILEVKPKLSPHVELDQQFRQSEGKWAPACLKLSITKGIPNSMAVEPLVAQFLCRCDGSRSIGELAGQLASSFQASPDQVRRECLQVVRKLIERGFILVGD